MTIDVTWEHELNAKAFEALYNHTPFEPARVDVDRLEAAYAFCTELTYHHSRTFFMASAMLPAGQRDAMRALYAFCRVSDDIVDRTDGDPRPGLIAWQERAFSPNPPAHDLVTVAWADARARYNIPQRYGEQLLDGVARDLNETRYETFTELADYCYGVASTVGLMSMHITGYSGPEAIPYAIKLGVALQMTNILRDVGEDLRIGRIYLPMQELNNFGLSESDLMDGCRDERWQHFVAFQIERTRRLYAESLPGINLLHRQGRFAVAAAAELYRAILDKIEHNTYDNFTQRAYLSNSEKLFRLPGIYWRSAAQRYGTVAAEPQR
jgi:phytoene synthase